MNGIIPVIDLKQGQVVHAVAGERDKYRPIKSCLAEGSSPSSISKAFRELGFESVYVADLDAITSAGDNASAYHEIRQAGLSIWLDSGIADGLSALKTVELGVEKIVVGLESISRSRQVADVLQAVGVSNMIVSLDMKNGDVLTSHQNWRAERPLDVASELVEIGVAEFILLDLCRVGTGQGTGTEILCQRLKRTHPSIRVTVGGGVSTTDDVARLIDGGADHVLVSSALHGGRISTGKH